MGVWMLQSLHLHGNCIGQQRRSNNGAVPHIKKISWNWTWWKKGEDKYKKKSSKKNRRMYNWKIFIARSVTYVFCIICMICAAFLRFQFCFVILLLCQRVFRSFYGSSALNIRQYVMLPSSIWEFEFLKKKRKSIHTDSWRWSGARWSVSLFYFCIVIYFARNSDMPKERKMAKNTLPLALLLHSIHAPCSTTNGIANFCNIQPFSYFRIFCTMKFLFVSVFRGEK